MFTKERRQQRREQFKKGVDLDDARRKREDTTIASRRELRDAQARPLARAGQQRF